MMRFLFAVRPAIGAKTAKRESRHLASGKETAPFRLVLEVAQMLGGCLDVSFPVAEGPDDREELGPLAAVRRSALES